MVFIWSTMSRYGALFILAVVIFTQPSQQLSFSTVEVGKTHNFTCDIKGIGGISTKDYTYKFYKQAGIRLSPIKPDTRIKQFGNVLTILSVIFDDGGLYSCAVFDEKGSKLKQSNIGLVTVIPVKTYAFKIVLPQKLTTFVDQGSSVEFRCEYGKKSTQILWEKQRSVNGRKITDFLPRDYITVLPDSTKSVEAYIIKRASLNDTGTYRCIVMEDGKRRSSNVRILQVETHRPPVFGKMRNVFVGNKNEDIRIVLEIDEGIPLSNIRCYRNDHLVMFCSGKDIERNKNYSVACAMGNYELTKLYELKIISATFSRNDGKYKCEASNVVGKDYVHFLVNVTAAPRISTENSEFVHQLRGEESSIKCIIGVAKPRPTITWFQQDLSNGEAKPQEDKWTISTYKSKLDFKGNARYESTLTIPWNKDHPFYRCFAENSLGNDSRVFKFTRFGTGDEPFAVTPRKPVVINEGKTFTATCRVTIVIGNEIVFYKDNLETELKKDNRTSITITKGDRFRNVTIVLRALTPNDTGTYRCSEKNVKLTNYFANVTLTVRARFPAKILGLQNQSVEYKKDQEVTLFCNVTGNPFPEIQWLREGKPSEARLVRPSCEGLAPGYFYKNKKQTKLAICKPDITHTGSFTCVARNQLGSDEKNVFLNVAAKPMIIKPKSRTKEVLVTGEAYKLPCKVQGNPTPLVQWILEDEKRPMTNESHESSTLEITEMKKSYVGNYTCRAWNSLGTASKSLLELELKPPEKGPAPVPGGGGGGGMAAGTIVGIVVAVAVVLILAFLVILLCYRRQQKKLLFYKHQYFLKTGQYAVDPNLTLNEQSMNLPYDSDWEFPFERLVLGERLGAGAFGEVYKAEAMGILALNPRDKSNIANKRRSKIRRSLRASQRPRKKIIQPDLTNAVVAVKTVKAQATESEIRDLAAELKLMIHIGEHKNIVNLLGACTTGRKLYVILEFCPYGNLLTFLRSKRDFYDSTWTKEVYDPEKEFTLIDIVGAAFQIAKGMEFLAGRKLIHRDLAARNILVANEYVMKISDFGLARDIYKNDVYVKTSSGMLPVKWMAVESLFDRVYTHQSDVWSFGVLLWEMMTLGGTPYPNLPAEQLLDYLNEGKRMPQPAKCPLEIYTIMRDCWQDEPEERPTFSNLAEHLGRILERHMEKVNPYLHVEASQEEIEAAREKDELLKAKSDYYLQPLLLSNNVRGYDSNAPLPTPPTDTYSEATVPLPGVETKPATKMNEAGSYERLRDDIPVRETVPLDNESGIGLDDMNNKHHENELEPDKKIESVV